MATLTVWKFDTADGADNALVAVQRLHQEALLVLIDGAVVSFPEGAKKPTTRQLHDSTRSGALSGAFWGLLFGVLFFMPLLGAALGAGLGAFAVSLADVGISDDFIKEVRAKVRPGTSALFLYTQDAVQDRVLEQLRHAKSHPELIQSNLSAEQEARLREIFGDEAPAVAGIDSR